MGERRPEGGVQFIFISRQQQKAEVQPYACSREIQPCEARNDGMTTPKQPTSIRRLKSSRHQTFQSSIAIGEIISHAYMTKIIASIVPLRAAHLELEYHATTRQKNKIVPRELQ